MLRKGHILAILVIGVSLGTVLSIDAQQNSNIPEWVKNNAKWWSEGTIEESDYLSSLQYLISQGIIKIPIKQVIATDSTISEEYFAHSFVVRITFDATEHSFYSFTKIVEFGEKVDFTVPRLQLEGIPSIDKKPIYEHIEKVFNKNTNLGKTKIEIDIFAGDGSLIETLEYKNCFVKNYWVYVNDFKDDYRYGKADKPELRDVFDFHCGDYSIRL